MDSKRELSAIESFIERVGLSAEEDGLPRIAGRMMAYFVINGGPVGFADLTDALQVSRGSVSTNTRILISLGVIERVSRPGERQDYFQLAERPYARMMAGYIERTRRKQATVTELRQALESKQYAGARSRLGEMQRFHEVSMRHLGAMLDELAKADAGSGK